MSRGWELGGGGSGEEQSHTSRLGFFHIALIVLPLLFLALEMYNGRFHQTDFRSYYQAAGRAGAGISPYGVTDSLATVPFLYPPPVAYLFLPFRALPITGASVAWYVVNVAMLLSLVLLLERTFGVLPSWKRLLLVLAIAQPLQREFHVGNVNLALTFLGLLAVAHSSTKVTGYLVPFVLIKPQNVVAMWPLILSGRRRLLLFSLGLCVALISPLLTYHASSLPGLYEAFARSLHSFDATFGRSFKYTATLAGLAASGAHALGGALPPYTPALAYGVISVAVVVYVRSTGLSTWSMTVALACAPLAAPGDTQTFLLATPLLYALLCTRMSARRWCVLLLAMVLFGANWHDVIGRSLAVRYDALGIRGMATLLLVLLGVTSRGPLNPMERRGRSVLQMATPSRVRVPRH